MKGVCRVCGCTDEHACLVEGPPDGDIITTCHWIDSNENLCSECAVEEVQNGENWIIPKECRFCNLLKSDDYRGAETYTCSKGRFDDVPSSTEFRAEGYHDWFAWSGIWRPNKTVKEAQKKCPHFTPYPDVSKISRRERA
jgi:hypothetical protein